MHYNSLSSILKGYLRQVSVIKQLSDNLMPLWGHHEAKIRSHRVDFILDVPSGGATLPGAIT